ncbi:hypothetical protein ABQG71_21705, partial [Bacillus altitudinis]
MKKAIYFFIIVLMLFSLDVFSIHDRDNDAKIAIGKSEKFSEEEIKEAIECTKKNFKSFEGCTLTDIWYDEEKSNNLTYNYLEEGNGGYESGATAENTIVLMCNFEVGSSGGDGSLEPNSTYTDWQ